MKAALAEKLTKTAEETGGGHSLVRLTPRAIARNGPRKVSPPPLRHVRSLLAGSKKRGMDVERAKGRRGSAGVGWTR